MRIRAIVAVAAILLPASVAVAGPAECERLARQIAHYEGMAERAEELGNPMWEDRTRDHIEVLEERAAAACPEYAADRRARAAAAEAARQFAQMMKFAGKAALTFFTMGAF